jgi:hypothetical protein
VICSVVAPGWLTIERAPSLHAAAAARRVTENIDAAFAKSLPKLDVVRLAADHVARARLQ